MKSNAQDTRSLDLIEGDRRLDGDPRPSLTKDPLKCDQLAGHLNPASTATDPCQSLGGQKSPVGQSLGRHTKSIAKLPALATQPVDVLTTIVAPHNDQMSVECGKRNRSEVLHHEPVEVDERIDRCSQRVDALGHTKSVRNSTRNIDVDRQ